jgi:hypothetical protein
MPEGIAVVGGGVLVNSSELVVRDVALAAANAPPIAGAGLLGMLGVSC